MDLPTLREFREVAESNPDEAERRIFLVRDHQDVYEPFQETHPGLVIEKYIDARLGILVEVRLARGEAQRAREVAAQVADRKLKDELLQQIIGNGRGSKGNGSNGKETK